MNDTINHADRVGPLTQFRRVALTQTHADLVVFLFLSLHRSDL